MVVKLHSGDPSHFEGLSVYLRALAERGIQAEIVPGVSSLSAVAASRGTELAKDQALIVIRPAGEPWRDDYRFESGSIEELSGYGAATAAAMAIFSGSRDIAGRSWMLSAILRILKFLWRTMPRGLMKR